MDKIADKLEAMQKGGHILALILQELAEFLKPGLSTQDIETKTIALLAQHKTKSAFLGFNGYPKNICVSINDEVVHGIPSSSKKIATGDLVKLDLGILYNGYNTDSAVTVPIGKISAEEEKLLRITKIALEQAINQTKAGDNVNKIGQIIGKIAQDYNLSVVEDLTGHGIGKKLHEPPIIYNCDSPNKGSVLREGDTIAIEPMFALGKGEIIIYADGWTIATKDSSKASHFEHTVVVGKNRCQILTK